MLVVLDFLEVADPEVGLLQIRSRSFPEPHRVVKLSADEHEAAIFSVVLPRAQLRFRDLAGRRERFLAGAAGP